MFLVADKIHILVLHAVVNAVHAAVLHQSPHQVHGALAYPLHGIPHFHRIFPERSHEHLLTVQYAEQHGRREHIIDINRLITQL